MSGAPLFVEVAAPARTRFGPIRRFAEIDSTNRYLFDEARAGAPEGTVVVADYQSAGRGRLGRRWEAPPGSNLLVSILLRPTLRIDELHLCTVAVALAAAVACERGAGVVPDLKWPNDLLVRDAKLGGILAEALPAPDLDHGASPPVASSPVAHGTPPPSTVVVGLGLNVGWPPPDDPAHTTPQPTPAAPPQVPGTPEAFAVPATSLRREAGSAPEPLAILGLVLEELEGRLVDLADADGRRRLASEYRRRCVTVGRAVRVTLPDEVFTGTATDITLEGHLIVDVGACLRTVAAGDVVHLRDQG